MVYQGFFGILMITLISSKNLGGYKILRNTVPALTPPPVPVATVVPTAGPVKAKICKAKQIKCEYCFVQPIFHFFFFFTLGKEVTKIRKYYVIFIYILLVKMGKTEKRKENHATKVTKISKTKRQKYGMKKTFDCLAFGDYSNC